MSDDLRAGPVAAGQDDPVHAQLRLIAALMPRGIARPWTLPLLRRLALRPRADLRDVTLQTLPLPGSSATLRHIAPPGAGRPRHALLWMHGGGYLAGDASQDDAQCARWAKTLGLSVLSVDYRLAPEHPWPAALDDCVSAWALMLDQAQALGLDPEGLMIGGMSAGGGLAAALALRLRHEGSPMPKLQLLVYPMLDDRTACRPDAWPRARVWDARSNLMGWSAYLGAQRVGAPDLSEQAAPARAQRLQGLPTTWIGVGTHDVFYEENLRYAQRLREAGVATTLEVVPGAFHGFDVAAPRAAVSRAFMASQERALRQALSA